MPPWGRAGCPVLAPGRLAGTCGRSRLEGARPGMQTRAGRAPEASGALDPRPDSRLLETWVSLGAGRPGGASVQNVRLEGHQVVIGQVGDVGRRVVPVLQLGGELAPALKPAWGGRQAVRLGGRPTLPAPPPEPAPGKGRAARRSAGSWPMSTDRAEPANPAGDPPATVSALTGALWGPRPRAGLCRLEYCGQ